jgi:hypothetical protein
MQSALRSRPPFDLDSVIVEPVSGISKPVSPSGPRKIRKLELADQRHAARNGGIGPVTGPLPSLLRRRCGLTGRNVGTIGKCHDSRPETGLVGWGGRDRTSACRNQNPVPYRLATPQQGPPDGGLRIKGAGPVRKPAKRTAHKRACGPVAGAGGHRYKGASRGEGTSRRTGSESSSAW